MTVKEIVKDYLERNGYDGLCTQDCGCDKDYLFPCCGEGFPEHCVPAYKVGDEYQEEKKKERLPFIVQSLIVIVPTILLWLLLFGLSLLINHDRWYVNAGITLVMVLIAGVAVLGMTKDDERDFSDVP